MNIGAVMLPTTDKVIKVENKQVKTAQQFINALNKAVDSTIANADKLPETETKDLVKKLLTKLMNEQGSTELTGNQADITSEVEALNGVELTSNNLLENYSSLISDINLNNPIDTETTVETISLNQGVKIVEQLLDNLKNDVSEEGIEPTEVEQVVELLQNELTQKNSDSNVISMFQALWMDVQDVFTQIDKNSIPKETELKLLKLLEQWTALEKTSGSQFNIEQLSTKDSAKAQLIWDKILQTYQKRMDPQMQQKYQSSSTVTTTDVAKWVKTALANYQTEATETKQVSNSGFQATNMPVSKVEQFVLHLNQTSTSDQEALQKKLVEEFQRVIKSSNFSSSVNGSNQLVLKLRPENLGDIMVRLTQMNGEMIVKITTTSQVAKEMLEGNIQQLRHMFAPQQVVIEKQELQLFQQEQQTSQQSKQSSSGESDSNASQEGSDNKQQDSEDNEMSFHQILMNEKV
ncbi:flagellar hook-length control protein FliK [Aquibacillus rhizosphaerae]|uniref:Flagellar hook-length control protein FliK n=1 Tax=Aquibacillus rhizosphaerae TaxID=3051431 RepID=A0ABT7L4F2_9BACI|nr:flagellar hook-length control protein FliK [Aquibacillus sp. LR5S19]MDL4840065.1 flagellar hook-length control protein FliK [Aquibacillus sp. LR5S19]